MAARVLRVIFRLDYDEVNYDFLDRQGKALRILNSGPEGFWSRVGDGREARSFAAEFSSEQLHVYRNLNASAMAIDGSVESRNGIALDDLPDNRDFRAINKILDGFCEEFKISRVRRCGLRLFCIESYGDNYASQFIDFASLVDGKLTSGIEVTLGTLSDLGMSFEGKAPDGISFRLWLGPFVERDLVRILLPRLAPSIQDEPFFKKAHVSVDLDFFEHDVSFKELTFRRWARTHWAKADAVLRQIRSLMLSRDK